MVYNPPSLPELPVEYWHEVVGNPTIADAIMDRLVHNAHKISAAPLRLAIESEKWKE